MININVQNPEKCSPKALIALAQFLMSIADEGVTAVVGHAVISSADNPATGAEKQYVAPLISPVIPAMPPAPPLAEPAASAIFGQAPLPNGVSDAHSIAGVGQPSIAPVVMPDTSTNPTAPLPPAPPIAPVAPIAAAPVPPGQSLAPAVELDKDNLPWDARIHASTKAKIASGRWKLRRGVDDATIKTVEAELHAIMAIPTAGNAVAVSPGVPAPPSTIAPSPAVPAVPSIPAPPIASGIIGFPQLVQKITEAVTAGKLTQVQVAEAVKAVGIPALPLLATRPDLVPSVAAAIDALMVG